MRRFRWPDDNNLRKINKLLLVLIILINGYVILAPFWPQAEYVVRTNITNPVESENIDLSYNHLIIPKLQHDEKILESGGAAVLNEGIWRRPNTSTPDKDSNTVIVGHRFTYKNHNQPFYHLNKLAVGDELIAVFNGKIYKYKIYEGLITNPFDQTVEAASSEPRLTLYTCDPLWTAENRLVYRANLEEVAP